MAAVTSCLLLTAVSMVFTVGAIRSWRSCSRSWARCHRPSVPQACTAPSSFALVSKAALLATQSVAAVTAAPSPAQVLGSAQVIWRVVEPVLDRGMVPAGHVFTFANAVHGVVVGSDAIAALQGRMLRYARSSVHLQTFIFEPQARAVSHHLRPALEQLTARLRTEAAQRGGAVQPVTFCVLLNRPKGLPAWVLDKKGFPHGATPEALFGCPLPHDLFTFSCRFHDNYLCDGLHGKMFIVDDEAVLPTANVEVCNHPDPRRGRSEGRYDYGLHVQGEVANSLRANFIVNWRDARTAVGPTAGDSCRPQGVAPTGNVPMLLVTRPAVRNPFSRREDNPQGRALLALLASARRRICVQTPNLNTPSVIRGIVHAAERGVQVRVLLSKGFNELQERLPLAGGSNGQTAQVLSKMTRGGDLRLEVRWYRSPLAARSCAGPIEGKPDSGGASHAKLLIVDDSVLAGSTNLDQQSQLYSNETSVVIFDANVTDRLHKVVFLPAWDRSLPT